jgi:hypothetical protein
MTLAKTLDFTPRGLFGRVGGHVFPRKVVRLVWKSQFLPLFDNVGLRLLC